MLKAFTDASFRNGVAGWGVVIVNDRGKRRVKRGAGIAKSSSVAELYAVLMAIEICGKRQHVIRIYTDCAYVTHGLAVQTAFAGSALWSRIRNTVSQMQRDGRDIRVIWKRRNSCRDSLLAHTVAQDAAISVSPHA